MNTFTKKLLITTGLLMGLATGANALDVKVGIYGTPLTGFDKKRSYFPGLRGTNSLLGMQDYLRVLPIPDKCDWENFKGRLQMVEQQQCIVDSVFWRKFIVQRNEMSMWHTADHDSPIIKMKLGIDAVDRAEELYGDIDPVRDILNAVLTEGGKEEEAHVDSDLMMIKDLVNRQAPVVMDFLYDSKSDELTGNEWVVVKVPLKTTILNRDKHITLIYWRDEAGKLKVGPITNPSLYMDGRFINQADYPYKYRTFSKGTKPGGGAGDLLFNIGGKCEGC
jgi:hypothetical protein